MRWMTASFAVALSFGVMPQVSAMHIMEGYLPLRDCIVWGRVCIPFFVAGVFSIRLSSRKTAGRF
jgi:cobalt/nickel transport system permease protein